jgi:hypothetical protein
MTSSKFLLSDPWLFSNCFANGLLFGMLTSYSMILGTRKVDKDGFSSKIAAYIMQSHLVVGLGLGSVSGYMMGKYVVN